MEPSKKEYLDAKWKEYSILMEGYHSRDEVVSQTFFEMIQAFTFFLVLINAAEIVVNQKILFTVYIMLSLTGFMSLLAFLLDLQGNASARRALRLRCCELELEMKEFGPSYWGSIRNRIKFFEESVFKPVRRNPDIERLASSDFFIISARFLIIAWVVFSIALLVAKL